LLRQRNRIEGVRQLQESVQSNRCAGIKNRPRIIDYLLMKYVARGV